MVEHRHLKPACLPIPALPLIADASAPFMAACIIWLATFKAKVIIAEKLILSSFIFVFLRKKERLYFYRAHMVK